MRPHKQSGFVLVIGLALLTIASGLVVTSMSLGRYQERQAGNYVRANNAQLGADEAFLHLLRGDTQWARDIRQHVSDELMAKAGENATWEPSVNDMASTPWRDRRASSPNQYTQPMVERVEKLDEDTVRVTVSGSNWVDGNTGSIGFSSFQAVFNVGGGDEAAGSSQDVLIGCEGVQVSGGGGINGDVRTLQPGAGVRLSGDANVDGNVTTLGALYTDSSITGNILAGGDITLDAGGGYAYGGSIATTGSVFFENSAPAKGNVSANGDVEFNNAATVTGNVSAGGKVIFDNSSAYVGGDIESQEGVVNTANEKEIDKFAGGSIKTGSHTPVSPVNGGECNPQVFSENKNTLAEEMDSLLATLATEAVGANKDIVVGNYPMGDGSLTPNGLTAFDKTWNVKKDVILAEATTAEMPTFDKPVSVVRTQDLTLKNGELNVSGGDVVLLVDGDLTLGSGGGTGLTIDQGSTLTIFVTGETHIKSSTQMADIPATTDGRPTLSLYSAHEDASKSSSGVLIDGGAQALASIYAPYANVSVTAGGGLRGAVRGKTVTVDGGAEIEYVPGPILGGGDGSGDNGDDDNSSAPGWSLEGLSYVE